MFTDFVLTVLMCAALLVIYGLPILGGLFCLLLTYAAIGANIDFKKKMKRLAEVPCLRCGVPLGKEVFERGKEELVANIQEARKEPRFQGRVNFARLWPLVCEKCSLEMIYDARFDHLETKSERLARLPEPPLQLQSR